MKVRNIILVGVVISLICAGCKSRSTKADIELLKKENEDLKAKVMEYEKELSYKNAIIENLRAVKSAQPSTQVSLPPVERLRTIHTPSIKNIFAQLKKQNFYGINIKGNTIKVIIAKNIFQSGSDRLTKKGEADLQKLAAVLKKNLPKAIKIDGYTDNTKLSDQTASMFIDNYGLSSARAKQAKSFLLKYLPIGTSKITVEGRGDSNPIASNATKAGRDINRRLEIYLYY